MKRILAIFLTTILLCVSCAVSQELSIAEKTGGTCVIPTEYFSVLLEDLSGFSYSDAKNSMDSAVSEIWLKMLLSDNCSESNFERNEDGGYTGSFVWTDLYGLLSDIAEADVGRLVAVTENSLSLRINIGNYDVLTEIVPILNDENLSGYGPVYNHGSSEEYYLKMMDMILGPGTSEAILKSEITLTLIVPGLVTQTNGTVDGDRVSFTIPLIKLLLLNEEIYFNCSWAVIR